MVNLDTVVDVQVNKRKKLQKNAKVVEAFKNKRKDSNDYKIAVNFLKNYFDDGNKIDVDA